MRDRNGALLNKYQALARLVGNLMPNRLPREWSTKDNFPEVVSTILFKHLARATRRSGRSERFHPLFNFHYRDNAPMLTVGGMIAAEDDATLLQSCRLPDKLDYVTGEQQCKISVPPLTVKEKTALDRLLPSERPPQQQEIESLGFTLTDEQVKCYHRFYQYYPLYGELLQ